MAYFICPRWEPAICVIQTPRKKVVYSQPRTGFILGAFTIAVPSKNILEDSQPSWVRSLHRLPSSICALHFHALHEFCTLSGRHIICIFPRFNWMQQVTTICYSTPPPSPSMHGLQFYAIGGRANFMVCGKKGQHHCTKKKSQVYAFVFLDHSSVCNSGLYRFAPVTIALCWTFLLREKSAG